MLSDVNLFGSAVCDLTVRDMPEKDPGSTRLDWIATLGAIRRLEDFLSDSGRFVATLSNAWRNLKELKVF